MYEALECKESVDKIIKEATVSFSKEIVFNQKPYLFQLSNCVLDLKTNTFREGVPSDLTSRRSNVRIPEAWLKDFVKLEKESAPMRQKAWEVMWSIFKRQDEFHEYDCFAQLGDQDEVNFMHLMRLHARLLEGTPLCKCIMLYSPCGRNSKGVLEKVFQSTWGQYYVPAKSTVFQADARSENEHSAAEFTRTPRPLETDLKRGSRVNRLHSVFKS